jgi:hypothetical protein
VVSGSEQHFTVRRHHGGRVEVVVHDQEPTEMMVVADAGGRSQLLRKSQRGQNLLVHRLLDNLSSARRSARAYRVLVGDLEDQAANPSTTMPRPQDAGQYVV